MSGEREKAYQEWSKGTYNPQAEGAFLAGAAWGEKNALERAAKVADKAAQKCRGDFGAVRRAGAREVRNAIRALSARGAEEEK